MASLLGIALAACGGPETPVPGGSADLVLRGGRIATLEPDCPEAEAVAIRGDRIVAVGTARELERWIGPRTERLELPAGSLVTPGFIESHAHFLGIGQARTILQLGDASSFEEVVERVVRRAKDLPPGTWILGRGWHQEKWKQSPSDAVEGFPTHRSLSQAVPDHPVLLSHASGHAAIANARALELASIHAATPDPPGGEILRFPDGSPTGVLRETAEELVERALEASRAALSAEERQREFERWVELAQQEVLSKGITTFHDAGSSYATAEELARLADAGRLAVRLWVMLRAPLAEHRAKLAAVRRIDPSGFLSVRAIKITLDGALGSRGAWLLEPYSDLPGHLGLATADLGEIEQIARLALEQDVQLCVHAIGDRANREILDLYERVLTPDPRGRERRWRVEHVQHLHPTEIPRFGKLGILAAMQAIHCTSDAPFVVERLGEERARTGAYAWRSLDDAGAVIANGTDAPVEDVDPIASFYATVTRKLPDGTAFFPEQRLTREEALKSYTWNGAYAGFEEEWKGSIRPGKLADLTIFDRNILTVPEEEILNTRVLATIVGGKVRYRRAREGSN